MDSILGLIAAITLSLLSVVGLNKFSDLGVRNVQTAALASQARVIDQAASQYVQDNATTLQASVPVGGATTIPLSTIQAAGYLPTSFSASTAFSQTWQVQVAQPTAGRLQALVNTTGGAAIANTAQLAGIAAQIGAEGGFVPYANQGGDATMTPTVARGAFGAWSVTLASSGFTNPGSGHVANLLAFSNQNANNSFMYRVAVPGHPELNAMQTDLSMTDTGGTAHNITGANNITGSGTITAGGTVSAGGGAATLGPAGATKCDPNTRLNLSGSQIWDGCDGNLYQSSSGGAGSKVVIKTNLSVQGNSSVGGTEQIGTSGGAGQVYLTSNASAQLGQACANTGAIAASATGTGQTLVCQSGVWVAAATQLGTPGGYCSSNGMLGQDSTATALICQGSTWIPLQARMGGWVFQNAYYTQNGWGLGKPTCASGSVPRIIVTLGGTQTVNSAGSVNVSANDFGSYWRTNIVDGYGNGLPGYAIAQMYCAYQ